MNIFNFRIDRNNRSILQEKLSSNILAMGWGGGNIENLDLRQNGNIHSKFKNVYKDRISIRRINSILKIRQFKDGDIIIIPHMPKNGKFIIGIVNGNFPECYDYDENNKSHLNHKINLKKIYGLNNNLDIHNVKVHPWYAKLKWMRLPIYPLHRYKDIFLDLIKELENDETSVLNYSKLGEYIDVIRNKVKDNIRNEFKNIDPSNSAINFENICKTVIESFGYELKRKNHHKNGGDADLIFTMISDEQEQHPFIQTNDHLYVQIKKHTGQTGVEPITQLLKILKEDGVDAQGCAITLGTFSEEAQALAESNDIILCEGDEFIDLFMKNLL